MNILHVIDMISQTRAGGSAKVPYQLGQAQAKLGHNVTIFASDYNAKTQQPPEGVKLVLFKTWLNLFGGIKITPTMLFADFSKFDIIHLHNYRLMVNVIAANQQVPCILQAHGTVNPIPHGHTKPLHDFFWRKLLFNKAWRYIADAEAEIGQYIVEGADKGKIAVIPVGIDFKEFAKVPARNISSKKTVLFLGRLHKNKGPDLLLKAIKILDREDIVFKIAGYDDGYESELKQQIRKLGIADRIDYAGPLYGRDKAKAYTQADVYAMPSRYELFGLTLLESLACGTPVIITDRCGVAHLLPPECGIVVPFDEAALAEAITKALDSHMADSYRQYRIDWAKQYDWAKIAPVVIKLYEEPLNPELLIESDKETIGDSVNKVITKIEELKY